MRAANITNVKRRVLQQAVAENLETIRDCSAGVRLAISGYRLRRAPLVLIPLMLADRHT
jgi:hypothetical protein